MPEFVPFRFVVQLYSGSEQDIICSGRFSEVSGLEVSMEPRAIPEGGKNWGEHQRTGPTKFSPVVLKRGVTHVNDLWSWIDACTRGANYGLRMTGKIHVYDQGQGVPNGAQGEGGGTPQPRPLMTWTLTNVLPIQFKGPDMSSTASQVAVEEMHLVHEGLALQRPGQAAGGGGV